MFYIIFPSRNNYSCLIHRIFATYPTFSLGVFLLFENEDKCTFYVTEQKILKFPSLNSQLNDYFSVCCTINYKTKVRLFCNWYQLKFFQIFVKFKNQCRNAMCF